MSDTKLIPYLFFNGNCREAMEFYKQIFGGEIQSSTYEETGEDFPGKDQLIGKIMNAGLSGGAFELMASDTLEASPEAKKVELCITGTDEEALRRMFEGLSEGGEVITPLQKMFWGDIFGTLHDKFGVAWMVDISPASQS